MACGLIASLVASVLGGCGPGQAEREGWRWFRNDRAEGAVLVLAAPDAGTPRLRMMCPPRSGRVELTITGEAGDGAVVELHSGEVWNRYPGAGLVDGETMAIQVNLAAWDPVLKRLADTGELTVKIGDRKTVLPNAFAPAHDFLAVCHGVD